MTLAKKVVIYIFTTAQKLWYDVNDRRREKMDNKKITVFDVADFFRQKEAMTHKKLQKLVYFAYAWYIALYNDSKDNLQNKLCVDTEFQAWVHGPVCKKLYDKYSNNYGHVDKYDGDLNPSINGEIKSFLEKIYKVFGKYTGDDLESMTHKEFPWQNARNTLEPYMPSNAVIAEEDMFVYYNSLRG